MTEPTKLDEVLASGRRVRLLAVHTLRGLLALKITSLVMVVAAGCVLLAWWLRTFDFGTDELRFLRDFGLGGLGFFGMLLAVSASAQVFFNDLADGTVAGVLTRPVRRAEYLAGHLAGVMTLLVWYVGAVMLLLGALLAWRGSQLGVAIGWAPLLTAAALQWLKLCLVAAMTLLLCSYASTAWLATGLALALTVVGHGRAMVGEENGPGWLRVWPDLARFDGEAWLAEGGQLTGVALAGLGAYWAGFMLLLSGVAGYVFQKREL